MRILNLIQCTNLGGMEQANLERLCGLQSLGHSIELISLNPLGDLQPLLVQHGIPATGLAYRGRGGWRSAGQLCSTLRQRNADALIMTGHNLLAMLALGDLCRGRRLLAIHFHHTGVKPEWQWRLIYRVARHRFQAVTFPSDFVRREAEAIYPPLAAISHTIRDPLLLPEPVDQDGRLAARRALGIPVNSKVIGNAGWLIKRKRFDVFLRVAQRIAAKHPDAVFVIAGDGPERATLLELSEDLEIADRLRLLGWCQSLETFYYALDVLLFSADWDTLPRTPLEAMSYGIPVVASVEHGGLSEIISRSDCGVLLQEHDVLTLAHVVTDLLNNKPRATAIGQAGRARVGELCDPTHHADMMSHLLRLN
jgi:glycosyltransferase involved in cell wall biosynthesis